jgi:hypothetical protein
MQLPYRILEGPLNIKGAFTIIVIAMNDYTWGLSLPGKLVLSHTIMA